MAEDRPSESPTAYTFRFQSTLYGFTRRLRWPLEGSWQGRRRPSFVWPTQAASGTRANVKAPRCKPDTFFKVAASCQPFIVSRRSFIRSISPHVGNIHFRSRLRHSCKNVRPRHKASQIYINKSESSVSSTELLRIPKFRRGRNRLYRIRKLPLGRLRQEILGLRQLHTHTRRVLPLDLQLSKTTLKVPLHQQ